MDIIVLLIVLAVQFWWLWLPAVVLFVVMAGIGHAENR